MPSVCPSRTMRASRVSLRPVATFAPSTKKVAGTCCSASASSTASVQRPFGPSSKVRATAGTAGEPRTNTSRRRLPSGRRTPGTPQAAIATAATAARTLALDARDPVAVEVDLHRRPAVLPVRPHGRVEGRRPMRRRIAERHTHLVERTADVVVPLVDVRPERDERTLQVVRVAHLGLLVPHVAAEVPRLARQRMRDARTLASARQHERADCYEGAQLFFPHTSSSACRVRPPYQFLAARSILARAPGTVRGLRGPRRSASVARV